MSILEPIADPKTLTAQRVIIHGTKAKIRYII